MATFVFVHGAFQGGWVWRKVSDLLQKRGHIVHTPSLSGCGYLFSEHRCAIDFKTFLEEKASYLETVSGYGYTIAENRPNYDLNTSISDMGSYLELEDLDDIVLVGHSFSGMICGALMMQFAERIRHAIFIDAVIPEANRSVVELAGKEFTHMLAQHRQDEVWVRPWPLQVFGVNGPNAAWFESRLRPFPIEGFQTPFPGQFDPSIRPASFVACRHTLSPFIRAMAGTATTLSWPVYELDAGHSPMISCPETLADALSSIVS
jgi:pimeloyl-ACP methyl ester carboxylesterase